MLHASHVTCVKESAIGKGDFVGQRRGAEVAQGDGLAPRRGLVHVPPHRRRTATAPALCHVSSAKLTRIGLQPLKGDHLCYTL